jgi:toxin ParE1/3/4
VKVVLTPEARSDIKTVMRWIGTDNLERAESFSSELVEACRALARHPKRFPVARIVNGHEVRKRSHDRYVILYRLLDKEIEILRVVHGARDWAALLDGLSSG